MWTRADLKSRAKAALKPFYWYGVLACIIAAILGAGTSGGYTSSSGSAAAKQGSAAVSGSDTVITPETVAVFAAAMAIIAVILVAAVLVAIFVCNVIAVGKLRYFMESGSQGKSAGMGRLFSGFSGGSYFNIVKVMFFKGLFIGLWSCLFIIPGIIKAYEYHMIPYLLADNPQMERREAFRISKQMMDGNKFNAWVLQLSFIGWYILGGLLCGIGGIFVNPYYEMTFVELYWELRSQIFGSAPAAGDAAYTDAKFQEV